MTNLHARERLMLALDVPDTDAARTLVEGLGDAVSFYKIGLELFLSGGYFDLADWLRGREKKIFADLKLFDVPQTVASAVKQLVRRDVDYVTVHGNDAMLRAAVEAAGDKPGILAVTVLTSLDQADMADLGFQADISAVVVSRARRAAEIGCAGVIASGQEAAATRAVVPSSFRIVVPGIRPPSARGTDDQKRTVDVEDAFEAGADHIVIGRPIRNAPDPRAAAEAVQDRIASFFGEARVGR